jgi:hypothetical protein
MININGNLPNIPRISTTVNTPREEVRVKGPGLDRFARFKKEEPALWKPARPANEFVPPSGQLESPIAHHLHNPSFYTLTPHDGETAENYRDSLPEEIETLCESCQSKLKDLNLSDGEGNVIDKVQHWTVQDPPGTSYIGSNVPFAREIGNSCQSILISPSSLRKLFGILSKASVMLQTQWLLTPCHADILSPNG